jgi:hypothetical protein
MPNAQWLVIEDFKKKNIQTPNYSRIIPSTVSDEQFTRRYIKDPIQWLTIVSQKSLK